MDPKALFIEDHRNIVDNLKTGQRIEIIILPKNKNSMNPGMIIT